MFGRKRHRLAVKVLREIAAVRDDQRCAKGGGEKVLLEALLDRRIVVGQQSLIRVRKRQRLIWMRDSVGHDVRRHRKRRVGREVVAIAERASKLVDAAGLHRVLRADLGSEVQRSAVAHAAVRRRVDPLGRHLLRLLNARAEVPHRQQRTRADIRTVLEFVGEKRALEGIRLRDERRSVGLAGEERNQPGARKVLLLRVDRTDRPDHRVRRALARLRTAGDVRQIHKPAVVEVLGDVLGLDEELHPLRVVLAEPVDQVVHQIARRQPRRRVVDQVRIDDAAERRRIGSKRPERVGRAAVRPVLVFARKADVSDVVGEPLALVGPAPLEPELMQVREHQRLDVRVKEHRVRAVLGGEQHQPGSRIAVRGVAAAGDQLNAADAVEHPEIADVLQRVLKIRRRRRVVDALELVGRFERKSAANRDRPGLIDGDRRDAAQQLVLVGIEVLALDHLNLRTGHRVRVDGHPALKRAAAVAARRRRRDRLEAGRKRGVQRLLRAV